MHWEGYTRGHLKWETEEHWKIELHNRPHSGVPLSACQKETSSPLPSENLHHFTVITSAFWKDTKKMLFNLKMFTVRKYSVCSVSFYNIRIGHKESPVFWNIQKWKEYGMLNSDVACCFHACMPYVSDLPLFLPLSPHLLLLYLAQESPVPDGLGPTKGYFPSKGNFSSPLLLVGRFYIFSWTAV